MSYPEVVSWVDVHGVMCLERGKENMALLAGGASRGVRGCAWMQVVCPEWMVYPWVGWCVHVPEGFGCGVYVVVVCECGGVVWGCMDVDGWLWFRDWCGGGVYAVVCRVCPGNGVFFFFFIFLGFWAWLWGYVGGYRGGFIGALVVK